MTPRAPGAGKRETRAEADERIVREFGCGRWQLTVSQINVFQIYRDVIDEDYDDAMEVARCIQSILNRAGRGKR